MQSLVAHFTSYYYDLEQSQSQQESTYFKTLKEPMLAENFPKPSIKNFSTTLQLSCVFLILLFMIFHGSKLNIGALDKKKYFSGRSNSNIREVYSPEEDSVFHDINVSETIYQIGNTQLEHLAVFKPLCVDTQSNIAFSFAKKIYCVRLSSEGNAHGINCESAQKRFKLRSLYDIMDDRKPAEWLEQNQLKIKWIHGVTILQQLTDDCANVAHFTRKILCLHHILENINLYTTPDQVLKNVLIVLRERILHRFENPSSFNRYHSDFFSSVIHPHRYELSSAVQFLKRVETNPDEIDIHLIQNFSKLHDYMYKPSFKYLCFETAIVPTYLRRRFFIDHNQTTTSSSSPASKRQVPIDIPTDSIRFRAKVSTYLYGERRIPNAKKRMVFLHRSGTKRVFTPKSEKLIVQLLKDMCEEIDFSFQIVDFGLKSFKQQYDVMRDASVAVGIHGANLVNTMFMPPGSVLLEIHPFGFNHEDMYINGGGSGLRYFSYSILDGSRYPDGGNYSSIDDCIRKNVLCLRYYRDAPLEILSDDYHNLEDITKKSLESAFFSG